MGENRLAITCCLTLDHLACMKKNTANYYLDACTECELPFKINDVLSEKYEDPVLLSLIAKKRSTTLKKLECKTTYNVIK